MIPQYTTSFDMILQRTANSLSLFVEGGLFLSKGVVFCRKSSQVPTFPQHELCILYPSYCIHYPPHCIQNIEFSTLYTPQLKSKIPYPSYCIHNKKHCIHHKIYCIHHIVYIKKYIVYTILCIVYTNIVHCIHRFPSTSLSHYFRF